MYPGVPDLPDQVNQVNKFKYAIEFPYEMEEHNCLLFLDIKLHYINNSLKLDVHPKLTNKNGLINFYSHHTLIKTNVN